MVYKFQFFQQEADGMTQEDTGEKLPKNKFYSPQFLQICFKKFIAFIPFWTKNLSHIRFPGEDYSRPNNGMVESYFSDLKTSIRQQELTLGKFGTLRVGRYIDFLKERIEVDIKEMSLKYADRRTPRTPKKKRDQDMLYEELGSQEEDWRGKGKTKEKMKQRESMFFGSESLSQTVSEHSS